MFFDLRGLDDRYFAMQHVPRAMTFASLLAVADVPATTTAEIYVRDIPWPIGAASRVDLLPGDLIVITRPAQLHFVHTDLHSMLQSATG